MAVETDEATLEAYRLEVRRWLADALPRLEQRRVGRSGPHYGAMPDQERVVRARMLQRRLYDGGYAGIAWPAEYGGRGLTPAHQRIFAEESNGYELPLWLNMSTLAILAPTILEFGTEEQKHRHIPAILKGEEFWAQLLSEPTGGSDLAGAVTRAERDGDVWILNGSKIWSSGAHLRDIGMCLARTDWDVPKHKGLTMFVVDLHQKGVEVNPIRLVSGASDFCQEFFTDVVLPADRVMGQVNEGWAVASRILIHERNAVGGGSQWAGGARGGGSDRTRPRRSPAWHLVELARGRGRAADGEARQLVAEAHALGTVRGQLSRRVSTATRAGLMPGASSALLKLMTSTTSVRLTDIGLELAGSGAVVGPTDDQGASEYGEAYLSRQTICLGGGTNEMQRNMISERVLGMPREHSADRDVPYGEVRRNAIARPG